MKKIDTSYQKAFTIIFLISLLILWRGVWMQNWLIFQAVIQIVWLVLTALSVSKKAKPKWIDNLFITAMATFAIDIFVMILSMSLLRMVLMYIYQPLIYWTIGISLTALAGSVFCVVRGTRVLGKKKIHTILMLVSLLAYPIGIWIINKRLSTINAEERIMYAKVTQYLCEE